MVVTSDEKLEMYGHTSTGKHTNALWTAIVGS